MVRHKEHRKHNKRIHKNLQAALPLNTDTLRVLQFLSWTTLTVRNKRFLYIQEIQRNKRHLCCFLHTKYFPCKTFAPFGSVWSTAWETVAAHYDLAHQNEAKKMPHWKNLQRWDLCFVFSNYMFSFYKKKRLQGCGLKLPVCFFRTACCMVE